MDKINEVLTRRVEKIYPSREAFEKVLRSGKKIRLYQGFDASMPNLHLGNTVGLLKLKQFQDLGHEIIFLIGDFTGMIGDPTDKSATRPKLNREQVLDNAKNWKGQAAKILDFTGSNPAQMMFNSQWLDKITFKDLIEISSNFTVQQMLERDFFQTRIKEEKPIFLHEFLYPLAQAIDSVEMDVDMEIGGNDQTFNMLAGRMLLKATKNKEKFVLTTKLLADAQGRKVGKTTGNALFLNSSPTDMFGGVMSFPDEVLSLSFELLTQAPLTILDDYKNQPMEAKKRLAFEIVKIYYSEQDARRAQEEFEKVVQKKETPTEVPIINLAKTFLSGATIADVLVESKLAPSKSEAKRLIIQGGIEVNNQVVVDPNAPFPKENEVIVRVGKRNFAKIKA